MPVKQVKLAELFTFNNLGRLKVDEATAGDIVVFSGIPDFNIGDTLVDLNEPRPLEPIAVEHPTMSITMGVNKSPFAGKSGAKKLTSRAIRERLTKELEVNVAMRVEDTVDGDTLLVSGRGLLHLTVLIETMRREGFELSVGPPKTIEKVIDKQRHEPFEQVDIDVHEEYSGAIIDLMQQRKGTMIDMSSPTKEGSQTLLFEVPSRAMVGVKSRMLTATRGLGVMTTTFAGYKPYAGSFGNRERGNLLSSETGDANGYGMMRAQERGALFMKPGDPVYVDQIIGIHQRQGDLKVNICRTKHLTNVRSAGKDDNLQLTTAKDMSLEDAVEYVQDGECVEITPDAIRIAVKPKR